VPNFSKVAESLNHLNFKLISACQRTIPPVFGHPNLNGHFMLYTDISQTA
jgi:hypothetical protein